MDKTVYFYSGPGLKLAGLLCTPDNYKEEAGKCPALIVCPGPTTGKVSAMGGGTKDLKGFAIPLVEQGYVVLAFYHRGVVESEGPEWRLLPMELVEDICNAITFLEQQPEVDADHIGLLGMGCTGGANASYVASIDPRVKCIVSVNGYGHGERWFRSMRRYWEWVELLSRLDKDRMNRVLTGESSTVETGDIIVRSPQHDNFVAAKANENPTYKVYKRYITLESAQGLIDFQPEDVVDRISPRAAMWICAEQSDLVPPDESVCLYEKAKEPKKLVIIKTSEADTLYSGSGFKLLMAHTVGWFDTYLKTT